MKLERVTLRIPLIVPSVLIDIVIIPMGALWIVGMLIFTSLARDENGRIP